jgi:aryl-alcohol dehydrogenase-like predicted oxidoreductase
MTTATNVSQRTLGRSDIQISPMGLGCWAIGGLWYWLDGPGGWGNVDDTESIRAIHAALDLGVNFFDTAANYGTGHSERILGRALEGKRDKAVIATKFGFVVDEAAKQVTFRTDDHLLHVRTECEDSLRRLNTDVIDLYQLEENAKATELGPLTPDQMKEIDTLLGR